MGGLGLHKRSWDLVSRVISRVAVLTITYQLITPTIEVRITLLTKARDPPSSVQDIWGLS